MDTSKIMKSFGGMEVYDEAAREQIIGVTTTGTGSAYVATVKGIDSLTKGASFTMIPHTANATDRPTLNVNNLGAKTLRQRLSDSIGNSAVLPSTHFFVEGKPVRVVYDGVYWIVDMPKPVASNLEGVVPIDNGGLGVDLNTQVGKVPYTTSNYVKFADWTKGALFPTGGTSDIELTSGILPVKYGGTGATSASSALNNLGITWGTSTPPSKGTPNSIYIQIV